MPSSSAARVPLTLVVWRPTGDDDEEERHVTSWDLIISELPLLLDPAKSPIHHRLIKHVEERFVGCKVESIYWCVPLPCLPRCDPVIGLELSPPPFGTS